MVVDHGGECGDRGFVVRGVGISAQTDTPGPDTSEPGVQTLGSRELPDGLLRVGSEGALTPGQTAVILVDLPTGYPAVTAVAAGCTEGPAAATTLATATTPRSAGRFALNVALPPVLSASARLFVRITHADGTMVESGYADFLLTP